MKTKDEFEKFCNDTLSPVLEPYYSSNKKKIFISIFIFLVLEAIIASGIFFIKTKINLDVDFIKIYIGISITLMFITILGIRSRIKENIYKINKNIIESIVGFISDAKTQPELKENTMISRDTISECRIFNLNDLKVTGRNFMQFGYKGKTITISDSQIYKYIKKDKKYVKKYAFDGQFISMTFNKPVRSFIYLIPNSFKNIGNKLLNYIKYDGTKVDLENPLFSKIYKVYSYDEIQARYILSLRLMERMTELDSVFGGKKYIVFRENGKMTLFVENETMETTRNMKLPVFKNFLKEQKYLLSIFKKLVRYAEIYEILDLGNTLYQPDKMVQQMLNKAQENAKKPVKNAVVSGSVTIPERKITTGSLSGIRESKRYGYKYCYENCVEMDKERGLILPYDIINTITFITPDMENPSADIIESKINVMTNEYGWEMVNQPETVVYSGNQFIKVIYKGSNPDSRKMTTFYYCNEKNSSCTCGINFKYYENDIENVSSQIENILSSFILLERIGGYMTNEEKGFEFQYKNALEKKDEKIYFYDNINVSTSVHVNREKYDLSQYIEYRKKELIELGWKEVEEQGEVEFGKNKFYKFLATTDNHKMETYTLKNNDSQDVWYQINFKSSIDVDISNLSEEVEFILDSFTLLNTKKRGIVESRKYGIKYSYENVNKIGNDTEIIFSNNRSMYIKLKNLKTFSNEAECIRNVICEYTELYNWVLKSELTEVIFGNNVYKKTYFSSSKTLGRNMDLYFRIIPETNYMLVVPVYYYNDEILELSNEVATVLSSLEMIGLKSGKELIANSGVSIEYKNAIGYDNGIVYYSTNTRVVINIYELDKYKDKIDLYESSNKTLIKNDWELIGEQCIAFGNKNANMYEFKMKDSKYKAKSYFIDSETGRQVYNLCVKYFDREDIEYADEIFSLLNSIKVESGSDGYLVLPKSACRFHYLNAFYDKKENEVVYHGHTVFGIVVNKIKVEESEEDFINSKIREMTAEHEWQLVGNGKESYGNNDYLKYVFKSGKRTLEKYILLPMKNDRNTVFQINIRYTNDNIEFIQKEKEHALSTFEIMNKIEGTFVDEKRKFSFSYMNANYLDDQKINDTKLYYPNGIKMQVYWTSFKDKYETLEDLLKYKEKEWVEEWKFVLSSGPELFVIGDNEFIKYKLKSQKSTIEREYYFYKNNKMDYYKYIVFEYYDNDIQNYLNEVMYILLTFKEIEKEEL